MSMSSEPNPAELWQATEQELVSVAHSHGPCLLASVGTLAAAPELIEEESSLRVLAARLALLLPAYPHLEPFLVRLCESSPTQPFRVAAAMLADQLLATLRAASSLSVAAPHLVRPPFVRCSELLALLAHASEAVRDTAMWLVVDSLRLTDAPRALLLANRPPDVDGIVPQPLYPLMAETCAPRGQPSGPPTNRSELPSGVACVGQELLCSLRREGGTLAAPDGAAADEPRLVPTEHCQVASPARVRHLPCLFLESPMLRTRCPVARAQRCRQPFAPGFYSVSSSPMRSARCAPWPPPSARRRRCC